MHHYRTSGAGFSRRGAGGYTEVAAAHAPLPRPPGNLYRLPAPVHQFTLIPQRGMVCHACIDAIRRSPIHRL